MGWGEVGWGGMGRDNSHLLISVGICSRNHDFVFLKNMLAAAVRKRPAAAPDGRQIKRPAAQCASVVIDSLDFPELKQEDLVHAQVVRHSGDTAYWSLDSFFRNAFRKYINAVQNGIFVPIKTGLGKLYGHLCGSSQKILSKSALLEIREIENRSNLGMEIKSLAGTALYCQRLSRYVAEAACVASFDSNRLLLYNDQGSQDETSMDVTQRQALGITSQASSTLALVAPAVSHDLLPIMHSSLPKSLLEVKQRSPAKIVQSTSDYQMLIHADIENDGFLIVAGSVLNLPQKVSANTAECYLEAALQRSSITNAAQSFRSKSRDYNHDSHPSNARMERGLRIAMQRRGFLNFTLDPASCACHWTYGMMKKSFKIMENMISFQIHYALSINMGANLQTSQRLIIRETLKRIRVRYGSPPYEHQPFKRQVLFLCLQDSPNQLLRILYAHALPNGDWTDHKWIDVWVPVGSTVDKTALGTLVGLGICNVFLPKLVTLYKRMKLKGSGEAIGGLAGLQNCHGMVGHFFPALAECHSVKTGTPRTTAYLNMLHYGADAYPLAFPDIGGATPLAIADTPASSSTSSAAVGGAGSTRGRPSNTPETDNLKSLRKMTKEDLNKSMTKVMEFLRASNGDWGYDALIFKAALYAPSLLMDKQIQRSSVKREMKLRYKAMQQQKGIGNKHDAILETNAVEAATNKLENKFFSDIAKLRDSDVIWRDLIPDLFKTRKRAALAHQLLTGLECWADAMHVDHNLRYPTRRYLALVSDALADELMRDSECLWDE